MESVHASSMCLFYFRFLLQPAYLFCVASGEQGKECTRVMACVWAEDSLQKSVLSFYLVGRRDWKHRLWGLVAVAFIPWTICMDPLRVVNQYLTVYSGRWYLTRVPAFERESQENQKLKTSLGSYLKKKFKKKTTKFQFVVAFLCLSEMKQNIKDINRHFPQN